MKLVKKKDLESLCSGRRYDDIPDLPFEWIGQGYGYKNKDAYEEDPDAICYIPEYSFDEDTLELHIESCYTRNDFIKIAGDVDKAGWLFNAVDWQHPEALIDEGLLDEDGESRELDERHLDADCQARSNARKSIAVFDFNRLINMCGCNLEHCSIYPVPDQKRSKQRECGDCK